jgi:release factor glutamine methyltransferase
MDDSTSPPLTIQAAVQEAARRLASAGIETARLDAEVLLRHVLGLDRTGYFLRRTETLAGSELTAFDGLVERRLARESVAYITGTREFMGRTFAVGPGVLVPRPETEILVEWALAWLAAHPGERRILDAGTGSGAIALSIAAATRPGIRHQIVASDVSRSALGYAVRNRDSLGFQTRVSLVRGSLADWHGGGIDLLLANLPYLRPEQVSDNPDLASEPVLALSGGRDGLDLIRSLLADAPRLLAPGGAVGLEIDPSQANAAITLAVDRLPVLEWRVIPDLAGLARHVVGTSR